MPSLTAIQTLVKIPICLPKNRPIAIPRGSGAASAAKLVPANETPALANPKIGTMRNATGFTSACSSRWSAESSASGAASVRRKGMANAAITPAMVACTPDNNVAYHNRAARTRYGQRAFTLKRFSIIIANQMPPAAASAGMFNAAV